MTSIAQRAIHKNLAFIDVHEHEHRILDATGAKVRRYIAEPWHFAGSSALGWSLSGPGAAHAGDDARTTLRLASDVSMHLHGSPFVLTEDTDFYIGARIDFGQCAPKRFFFGLASKPAHIGFSAPGLDLSTRDGATEIATKVGAVGAGSVDLELYWSGAEHALHVYVNSAEVAAPDHLPTNSMQLALELSGDAQPCAVRFAWLRAIVLGR